MNLLRNGLLIRKTEPRQRTVLTEKVAFPCGLSAEFVIVANLLPMLGQVWHHTKSGCILTAQRSRLSIMRVLLLLYSRHHELSQGF